MTFDPSKTPYVVTWFIGRGYHSDDITKEFATFEEAIAAYNGPRPRKTVCDVMLRDWRLDQPFIDLRKTCLARRSFNFTSRKWVRYESKLEVAA